MNYKKNNGFVLVETMLAITLVSSVASFSLMQARLKNETLEVQALGRTLTDLIAGFDKKVTLEGHVKNNIAEGWTGTWLNSHDVYNDLILDELVAFQNTECGKPTGWQPFHSENSEIALVSCNIYNPDRVPFHFQIEAEAHSTAPLDGSVKSMALKGWTVRLFHESYTDWKQYGHVYNDIIKAARVYDVARVSGRHNYRLVHRGTARELTGKECYQAENNCAIEASFSVSDNGVNVDSGLRTDGKNSMRANLSFSVDIDSDKVACYTQDGLTPDGLVKSECGLEYSEREHKLNLLTDDTSSVYTHLMPQFQSDAVSAMGDEELIPVQVLCNGQRCGFSYYNRDGSASATAYLNKAITDEVVFKRSLKEISDTIAKFEVNEKGVMSAWNATIRAEGSPTDRAITLVTDAGDSFVLTNEGDLTTLGELRVAGDTKADELNVGGSLVADELSTGQYFSVGVNSVCTSATLGAISSVNNTGLFSCTNSGWVPLNKNLYDQGLIYGTESGECDYGFSPFSSAGGRKFVNQGWVYSSTLRGGSEFVGLGQRLGDKSVTLTEANLAPHSHKYYDKHSNSRDKTKNDSHSPTNVSANPHMTSSTGGGSHIDYDIRDPSYGVQFCIKD